MYYENFEMLCKESGVNPRTVSLATGIAAATLSNWKKGNYTPKTDKLQKICDYFGVPLDYLTGTGIIKKTISQELNDSLLKAYYEENNKEVEYPVYLEDSKTGKRVAKAKIVSLEPIEELEPHNINNSSNDSKKSDFFDSLSAEEQKHIIDLYQKYQNADPKIQAAVEALLKDQ